MENSTESYNTNSEPTPNPAAKEWHSKMQEADPFSGARPAYNYDEVIDDYGTVLSRPFENEMDAKQELEKGQKLGGYPTTARAVMLSDNYYYVIEPKRPNRDTE